MVAAAKKPLAKNPPPIYPLAANFRIVHLVTFTKNSDQVIVYAIPDDKPDTTETFDETCPPCIEDFSIEIARYKTMKRFATHANGPKPWYPSGAAVLLQLSSLKYVYIGETIMTFEMQPKDDVMDFQVVLQGNRAEAWVRGKNNTYLLSSSLCISNKHVDSCGSNENPYSCTEACDGACKPIKGVVFHY